MKPVEVKRVTQSLPYMTIKQAEYLYKFLIDNKLCKCLELGFYHGVSSAYIAGAIQDMECGHLTTIDVPSALTRIPNISQLINDLGLTPWITIHAEHRSYTWTLLRFLELNMHCSFDFCYIDGDHSWDGVVLAASLVTPLIRPGGWILFDDLYWTYRTSPALSTVSWVTELPEQEQTTPAISRFFELVLKRDPRFCRFLKCGSWGFAQKR